MKIVKNSVKRMDKQNFLCRSCGKQFRLLYHKPGCQPEVELLVGREKTADVLPLSEAHLKKYE